MFCQFFTEINANHINHIRFLLTFIKSVLHYDEHFPDGCPVNRHDRLFLKPQLLWPEWKDSSMILRWSSHRDTTTTNKEFLFTKTHINIIDYIRHTYKKTLSRYCAFNVKHGIRSHQWNQLSRHQLATWVGSFAVTTEIYKFVYNPCNSWICTTRFCAFLNN